MPRFRARITPIRAIMTGPPRSGELITAHPDEPIGLDGTGPVFRVPAKRDKKRRVIEQALSSLALEIIREALARDDQQFVFESRSILVSRLDRSVMSAALRGTKRETCRTKTKTPACASYSV